MSRMPPAELVMDYDSDSVMSVNNIDFYADIRH